MLWIMLPAAAATRGLSRRPVTTATIPTANVRAVAAMAQTGDEYSAGGEPNRRVGIPVVPGKSNGSIGELFCRSGRGDVADSIGAGPLVVEIAFGIETPMRPIERSFRR